MGRFTAVKDERKATTGSAVVGENVKEEPGGVGTEHEHHDDRGLIWPDEVAPADVHVVAAGKDGQVEAALTLARELVGTGLRVLVDDRPGVSAGVKFTDAELIGIPRTVVIGRRLSEGYGELRDRRTGQREDVRISDVSRLVTRV